LTKLTLQFKPVVKDRLFYNRYQYCCHFRLQEVSCLRDHVDHAAVDVMLQRRKEWREIAEQRWQTMSVKPAKTVLKGLVRRNKITDQVEQHLHDLVDLLLSCGSEYKLVVSSDVAWIYTNDAGLIDHCRRNPILTCKSYTQAVVDRPKNTIRLQNPRHKFRSYFAVTKLTQQQKTDVVNFLANQADFVRTSPALTDWICGVWLRTQDYYFVDHDQMSWLTMFALVRPSMIRKTVQIIPAK